MVRQMVAQDFCHMSQCTRETVAEFISRLEKTFCKAYGHESITTETCNTLLHRQLHEGLRYTLLKAPAVSGASNCTQLHVSVATRNEEGRQTELARRQHYQQDSSQISRQEVTKRPELVTQGG